MSDISFLSRDEALLLFNGDGRNVSLGVYSFPLQRMVCECRFPFLKPIIRAAFLTRPESRFGEKCPSSIAKCLLPDPELNIISMIFRTSEWSNPECCVVSLKKFQHMYNSLLKKHPHRNTFEWNEWDPTVIRWLPSPHVNPSGNRNVFGSRMLAWGKAGYLHDASHFGDNNLILLDFNPRPIKRGATTDVRGESHEIVINHETSWRLGEREIKSSLPYRAFTTRWLPEYPYFRFDASTILAKGVSLFPEVFFVRTSS
jgi:hypothetical protein